jgi:cell division protein FtsN
MANVPYTHGMGAQSYSAAGAAPAAGSFNSLTSIANFAAAGLSVALIIGVGVWGYKLMVRDVTGLPVVQAASGAMRVLPDNPGGQLALNQGLSVNEVAGAGTAAAPADKLILAPKPVQLASEDTPVSSALVAPVQQPEPLDLTASAEGQSANTAEISHGASVEDLVRQLTAGAQPIEAINTVSGAKVVAVKPSASVTSEPVAIQAPGLVRSLRPALRPASAPAVVVAAAAPAQSSVTEVAATSVPAGTRLVQLGAFDSAEVARSQWDKIDARFTDFLDGKSRIIQKAKSGGRTFYRLRAMGFEDLSDARRFCSALLAEKADCIPVVTR